MLGQGALTCTSALTNTFLFFLFHTYRQVGTQKPTVSNLCWNVLQKGERHELTTPKLAMQLSMSCLVVSWKPADHILTPKKRRKKPTLKILKEIVSFLLVMPSWLCKYKQHLQYSQASSYVYECFVQSAQSSKDNQSTHRATCRYFIVLTAFHERLWVRCVSASATGATDHMHQYKHSCAFRLMSSAPGLWIRFIIISLFIIFIPPFILRKDPKANYI